MAKKIIIPLAYMCLNRLRFNKDNSIRYWNIMKLRDHINLLKVNAHIIFLYVLVINHKVHVFLHVL